MPKAPKCPKCGSADISYPGHCSYHWRNGKWVVQRGSEVMATDHGAPMGCQDCGANITCDHIDNPSVGIALDQSIYPPEDTMKVTQEHYDAAERLRNKRQERTGGCFAPSRSTCDETHCECAQIAFDQVIAQARSI